MSKKVYDDDDGRTIVDMSGVSKIPLMGGLFSSCGSEKEKVSSLGISAVSAGSFAGEKEDKAAREPQADALSKRERRWVTLGAAKAALLIGMVYMGGLLLVIGFLILLWTVL